MGPPRNFGSQISLRFPSSPSLCQVAFNTSAADFSASSGNSEMPANDTILAANVNDIWDERKLFRNYEYAEQKSRDFLESKLSKPSFRLMWVGIIHKSSMLELP